jgi:hypothetical protein
MAFGPKHVRMTSATVFFVFCYGYFNDEDKWFTFAAVIFEIWAFRPDCRSGAVSSQRKKVSQKISRKSSSPTYSSQKLEFVEPSEGMTPMIGVAIPFC